MTAKEYLSRVRGLDAEIKQLLRIRQRAWEQVTRTTSQLSKAPAHGGDRQDPLTSYVHYSELLEARTAELLEVQRETLCTIEQVQDSRYRRLLRARYLEGMTWEQIAVRMGYSWRQVVRMHGDALNEVDGIMLS